jgi:PhoPQ-activated pathogenicity-related protein
MNHPGTPHHARTVIALSTLTAILAAPPLRADLAAYVKAPDETTRWKVERTSDLPGGGSVTLVHLTSQTWQGEPWEHWLGLIRPATVTHPKHCLLVISGGSRRKEPPNPLGREGLILTEVARRLETVVAVLPQVPNQPLFDGLKEDALIAHTFVKYLETGDATWPCLLPMTKSAVKAMDAIQAVAKEKHSQDIQSFIVTGGSKRGWTTWLTAAVDGRVTAIAPMVIDTLNMSKQMALQRLSFGGYSEEIQDYTSRNLPERMAEPGAKRLLDIVDPYAYLARLAMPKLIVLGTNDRYWPVDAVKLYFGDLPGEKHIHYVPNKGHGLGVEAVEAVTAFTAAVIAGDPRPAITWRTDRDGDAVVLSIESPEKPEAADLWRAEAPTRDFREAKWTSAPASADGDGRYTGKLSLPAKGFAAFFGRLTFKTKAGHLLAVATNVEVLGDGAKAP